MKTNETSQATYTVEKSTILNVRHENGMRTQYELDEDKGCLQLKSVYMKDEKQSVIELPAFIIFKDVNFPVTSIAACVLKDMQVFGKVKKVILPPTVTRVSEFAFVPGPKSLSQIETSDPELLENVYIPDGVEVLTDSFETVDLRPKHHFRYTNKKEGYSLLFCMNESGNKLTLSGYENIAKGINVVIPKEVNGFPVTKIGDKVFSWCTNLTGIVIPDSVREIGEEAFFNCENLTNLVIPDSVVRIRSCAFVNCDQLTGIVIPDSVMDIEDSILCGCSRLSTIVVAEGNKFYDSREGCNAIIETATNTLVQGCAFTVVPDTVEVIGYNAFNTCDNLEHMVIPNSVTKISEYAFFYCINLKTLVLSDSVEEIGESAFYGCESMDSIEIPQSVTKIGQHAFSGVSRYRVISAIAVAEGNPVYDSRKNCNAIIETATNTLLQGGNTTIIPDTVTKISSNAFMGCEKLFYIHIPDSVTEIGACAFYDCTSLDSIDIPASVTAIGNDVFRGCKSLTSIAIPDSVQQIGSGVFEGCTNLRQVVISDASLLEKAKLPKDVKIVDKTAAITEVVHLLQNKG